MREEELQVLQYANETQFGCKYSSKVEVRCDDLEKNRKAKKGDAGWECEFRKRLL